MLNPPSCCPVSRQRQGRVSSIVLLAVFLLAGGGPSRAAPVRGLADVEAMARSLAARAYQPSPHPLPAELQALSYDKMRDIRFNPERAWWREAKLPFELMFFHPGGYHPSTVQLAEITSQGERFIPYDPKEFDFGHNTLHPDHWQGIGYAGWRAHYALNRPDYKDEVIAFLGASYFRAVGAGERYGLSARGLAIDTVGGQGEEFPRFTRFWFERPKAADTRLTVLALLDSPRASGAYQFVIQPGSPTVVDVSVRLFLRGPVSTLGIAPLTSMFYSGENQPVAQDYRPEVHDSDGLLLAARGTEAGPDGSTEWLWRPLQRPSSVQVNSFQVGQLQGFGLLQRDRQFSSYEDTEARYELRPSAWVQPRGDWGAGQVQLVQLPAPDETHDNIVAYWVPAKVPARGQPLALDYRLTWGPAEQVPESTGHVVQTRVGQGWASLPKDQTQYVIDFALPARSGMALPSALNAPAVQAVASATGGGEIVETNVFFNEPMNTWRMTLRVRRTDPGRPVELRAYLQQGPDALSETWTYTMLPR
jgi:glucans biosynthesis protein